MIVTSFSQRGYHEYGRRFIESFIENWPDEELICYYGELPRKHPTHERVKYIDLYEFEDFKTFNKLMKESDPIFQGLMQGKKRHERIYNFRFDAARFWKKVYAITNHAANYPSHLFAWVDADVYIHSKVPQDYLKSLIQPLDAIAALQRQSTYTETGFIIFDTGHPMTPVFMRNFWQMYSNGAFKYLGEFHDCYVMDMLINMHEMPVTDLTNGKESDHPFIHSDIGKYADHLKGPERKKQGRSDISENKSNHDAPYWQDKPEEETPQLMEAVS